MLRPRNQEVQVPEAQCRLDRHRELATPPWLPEGFATKRQHRNSNVDPKATACTPFDTPKPLG